LLSISPPTKNSRSISSNYTKLSASEEAAEYSRLIIQSVSNKENWKFIADEMAVSIPDGAGFFKRTYFRLLFPYEQKYYFGKEPEVESMDIIPDKKRKLIKWE
jgi:hypothetical protein